MNKFSYKVAQFMQGRYGNDKFGNALLIVYLILIILNMFVRSYIISFLLLFAFGYSLFRMFSRNIARRRAENEAFIKIWNNVSGFFRRQFRRVKDIKTHRYRKCPYCKKVLRLPRKTGAHSVVCPCCKNKFGVNIRF